MLTLRRMAAGGLVRGTEGNASSRAGDLIAVSPTTLPYDTLRPEDVCLVTADGELVDQPGDLLRRAAVAHVGVVEDLREQPSALVLTNHVGRDPLLLLRAREEERERVAEEARNADHGLDPS